MEKENLWKTNRRIKSNIWKKHKMQNHKKKPNEIHKKESKEEKVKTK